MKYTDQLAAARYRAERDQARQELDRLRKETEAMRPRLMPEGMEWPRFEDGEPVRIGNEVHIENEKPYPNFDMLLESITISSSGFSLTGADCEYVEFGAGERVKRPAPKVLDADGAEIRVGDVLYRKSDGHMVKVAEVYEKTFIDADDYVRPGDGFTHRAPVLAADGRPLREGETVYLTDSPTAFVVDDIMTREDGATVVHLKDGAWNLPQYLTHERPDSWERLEEDVANASCPDVYCANHHIDANDTSYEWAMARDIVRRAKALAGGAK